MKKRMMKMAAMMMAMTMVMGSAMTVHASEDGCVRDDGVSSWEDFDCGFDSGSSDSGSSSSGGSSNESYSEPSQSYDGGGSDDGCARDEGVSSWEDFDCGFDSGSSSSSGVTGKEQFRALAKSGEGSYKVTHKGQTIATFWLVDAEGKSVPCTAVALKQRTDDKKWAINFEVADSEGLNIGAPLDRTYMFKTLGVSYVTINDAVIIDIEAESAAAK